MTKTEYTQIGKRIPIIDARSKVTGKAVYGTDVVLPHMLHARILRSPYAHARILNVDTSKAEKVPGVRLVVTGKSTPAHLYGVVKKDEYFFARDEVNFVGDEVAAIVAVDRDTADEALSLIEVEYEPLPAVFDINEALKSGSPVARLDIGSNVCHSIELARGDIDQGFEQAVVVHEETYNLPHQHQAYIEPMAAAAYWERGRLTLVAPGQAPRGLIAVTNDAFNLPKGAVQFIQTKIGGGFGGKTLMPICIKTALLAKLADAPVHLVYGREEDFESTMPRIPMQIKIKMGADREGHITAKDVNILADNGAYTGYATVIVDTAATRVDTLYRFKNLHVVANLVYTNKMPCSAFRGFGNPQAHFAVESTMDTLAEKLGMSPKDIRLCNATRCGDVSAHGWVVKSSGLSESIEKAAEVIGKRKKSDKSSGKARGIGLACGLHVSGNRAVAPAGDGSSSQVRVYEDGTVHVATSEGDIGQGASTIFAQMAAEELQLPMDRVFVDPLDTDMTSIGVGAVASRVSVLGGGAVRAGAIAARQRLIESAANRWDCEPSTIEFQDGMLINMGTEETMSLADAATHYVGMTGGSKLMGEGFFRAEGVVVPDKTKYGNISLAYAFATQAAEVEVDTETGVVKVLRLVAVHDSGTILNRLTIEGQIEGGLVQGLGYALMEEFRFQEGRLLNSNFTDYQIPTSLDIPEIEVLFVETEDPNTAYGAKSVGEMAMVPTAAAIANAIYDAIGIRLTELPMTPERVLAAIHEHNTANSQNQRSA